jgi:predicted TIM-barrel fold metal-dependent hydrolase
MEQNLVSVQTDPIPKHDRFFNCHAHCFTMDHVPAYFFGKLFPVGPLLNKKWVKKLVQNGPVTGKMPWFLKVLIYILGLLSLMNMKKLKRLLTMVRYGNTDGQEKVIEAMRQYYPEKTGYVFLTMDMEYMGAGTPKERYQLQLSKLAGIKNQTDPTTGLPQYKNIIYPFIFIDPRRITPLTESEKKVEDEFIGEVFLNHANAYIEKGDFQGLKIYPALGYYPFDVRLKPAYDMALKYELPITTHCTIGVVHHKYRVPAEQRIHPITKKRLPNLKPADYQQYFGHPLNYECLMNKEHLIKLWGDQTTDYSQLKLCIGHWGSEADWHRYLENDWADLYERIKGEACAALDLKNWYVNTKEAYKNFTWFTVICEMIRSGRYPNLYTDISYTLHDASLLSLLKTILEADDKIRERVLFGTDFYMVSKTISERSYAINLRAVLGEDLFEQIAVTNARRFISNKVYSVR